MPRGKWYDQADDGQIRPSEIADMSRADPQSAEQSRRHDNGPGRPIDANLHPSHSYYGITGRCPVCGAQPGTVQGRQPCSADGGSGKAFPDAETGERPVSADHGGLRDDFAKAALEGAAVEYEIDAPAAERMAVAAYRIADAMLRVRLLPRDGELLPGETANERVSRLSSPNGYADDPAVDLSEPTPAEAARVADPGYTPTVAEAMRHPDAFVAGMAETSGVRRGLPPGLGRRRPADDMEIDLGDPHAPETGNPVG